MKQTKILLITCNCGSKKYIKYKDTYSMYSDPDCFICFSCLKYVSKLFDSTFIIDPPYSYLDINEQYINPDSIKISKISSTPTSQSF